MARFKITLVKRAPKARAISAAVPLALVLRKKSITRAERIKIRPRFPHSVIPLKTGVKNAPHKVRNRSAAFATDKSNGNKNSNSMIIVYHEQLNAV